MSKSKWTYTAGTEGTGEYKTVLKTRYGKVAFRDLGGSVRVRVEPSSYANGKLAELLGRDRGWKQPGDGGQNRFSKVVSASQLKATLEVAKLALGVGRLKSRQNPAANVVAKQLTA